MVRSHQPGQAEFRAILPKSVDWKPFPAFPPSVQLAVLVGQPSEPAPYVIRVKVPSGVKLMPHRHPEDRVYTVMSGVFYIGLGDQFDGEKVRAYPPGSVIVLPGDTFHFHWAKSGEYVTQVTAVGPLGLEYFDAEDDPRVASREPQPNPQTGRASGSCRRAPGWSRAAHRALDQLLDAADIFDRLRRQVGPGARAARRFAASPRSSRRSARRRACAAGWPADSRALAVELVARRRRLISSKPSRMSSLVSAMPSMPETCARSGAPGTASNQPQRRLRPVTVPNSRPRSPMRSPISSCSSVGNGPRRRASCRPWRCRARSRSRAAPGPSRWPPAPATVFDDVTKG